MKPTRHIVLLQSVSFWDQLALSTYLRSFATAISRMPNLWLDVVVVGSKTRQDPVVPGRVYSVDTDVYSPISQLRFGREAAKIILKIHSEKAIDVVHCFYPNSSLLAAVLALRRSRDKPFKILYDVRSPWIRTSLIKGKVPRILRRLYVWLAEAIERILASNLDGISFITDGLRRDLQPALYPADVRTWISPSGVDVERFRNAPPRFSRSDFGFEDDCLLIGYVGVLSRERQLPNMLDIVQQAMKEEDKLRLMIIGDGNHRGILETRVKELGIEAKVRFLGMKPHDEVTSLVKLFDWGICHLPDIPAFATSFPMKILEYRAGGVPVLASRMPAHEDIAARVSGVRLYSSPQELLAATREPRPLPASLEEFDWATIARNYSEFYEALAGTRDREAEHV